jgi:translation initiation factor 2B subunit (eIF-2B alpha/beta/delta family)
LADEGIKSEIILEANIPKYVNKSDICVIGADIILDNKSIVNKIGSKSLAINCLHFKKPFLVISDSSKFSRNIEFKEKEKPKSEIWAELPASIKCSNKYFEIVEKELITRIITEEAII